MAEVQKMNLGSDQLVTFHLGGEELALPITSVQEIIKLPEITQVPNTPDYLDGIGNLRGGILPVVNLRRRLGLEEKSNDDSSRIVVINSGGVATGFVVDSVSEVMHIEESVLETPPETSNGFEGQYLRGIAKIDDGKRLVLILAEDQVLPELAEISKIHKDKNTTDQPTNASNGTLSVSRQKDEVEQLVTFNVADEEFAIGIMQVKEIIRFNEITPVPKAPSYIVGVLSLRNQLLPIMDLRILFGQSSLKKDMRGSFSEKELQDKIDAQRIIVVDLEGTLTGILVDSVSQVLTLEKKSIEPPPAIISLGSSNRLRGVGKLENGKRLLMLLQIERLISTADKEKILEAVGNEEKGQVHMDKTTDKSSEEMQLVCFKVDHEEYAVNIMKVQEIIRINEITTVPKTKEYMKGIINLRGTVVPVVDMRTRFGLNLSENQESCRIVVVNIADKITGLIVDSVTEVLRVSRSQIEAPPESVADVDGKFIEGVGKFNEGKRIIVLINVDCLLADEALKAS